MSSTPSLKRATLKSGRGSRPGFSSSPGCPLTVMTPNFSLANSSGLRVLSMSARPITSVMGLPVFGHDLLDHRVGLGCTPVMSSGLSPPRMRRKPAPAPKVLAPRPATSMSCLARLEGAVGLAPAHHGFGHVPDRPDASSSGTGGVQVHAHRVHAVFHHGVQRARQFALVHVVLVLAHADALGVDLHQLGQRVLQAAGDAGGAAQAHVHIGHSWLAYWRRIHRGPASLTTTFF